MTNCRGWWRPRRPAKRAVRKRTALSRSRRLEGNFEVDAGVACAAYRGHKVVKRIGTVIGDEIIVHNTTDEGRISDIRNALDNRTAGIPVVEDIKELTAQVD